MKLKKKKIHIELRQFCLIYFPESTHSMELRMTNFTGYMYYISLYRSRNRKGTLFVSFLFLILFFDECFFNFALCNDLCGVLC